MRRDHDAGVDLTDLRVADIMVHPVVTVGLDATVAELIEVLTRNQISGVPVVGEDARLEGVVTATDVLRLALREAELDSGTESVGHGPRDPAGDDEEESLSAFFAHAHAWVLLNDPILRTDGASVFHDFRVADIMTRATFTVAPDTPLPALAAFLSRGRIHRAVVLHDDRLVGIVTCSDVVRALARDMDPTAPASAP